MKKDFFQVISTSQFLERLKEFSPINEKERLFILNAYQRVLAEDLVSPEPLPPFDRSTMDGYAVIAKDTFGASESNPVYLKRVGEVEIGKVPDFEITPEECAEVVTGSFLPKGTDGVVMVEHTEAIGDEIEIRKSVAPGENIVIKGEDCQKGEKVLSSGIRLRSQDIGILAALGIKYVSVYKKPKVAIISTGDELVDISEPIILGKIRDVNTYTLFTLALKSYAEPVVFGIVPDRLELLEETIAKALNTCDVVIISGGSSVGTRDLTTEVIENCLKGRILVHGVAISPGKPTILADINGKPVLGLPGQVTSAQVVMHVLVCPFLKYISGEVNVFNNIKPYIMAKLNKNIPSKQGREDWIRVKIKTIGDEIEAEPVFGKSGLLKTLLEADGMVCIPSDSEGMDKGQEVKVYLF